MRNNLRKVSLLAGEIGGKLRNIRKKLGLTQEEPAKKVIGKNVKNHLLQQRRGWDSRKGLFANSYQTTNYAVTAFYVVS